MGSTYNVANDGKVTITNDLVVDTNVLKVDTTANRIGINVTTPLWTLDVDGDCNLSLGSLFRINGNQVTSAILADSNSLVTNTLASGDIWIGDANNIAAAQTISGDLTIDSNGVATISGLADVVNKSLLTAKGDIFVASANATPSNLGISTDGYVLTANSAAAVGISWDPVPQSGHVIESGGTPFPQRLNLNFTGSVIVQDDSPNVATKVYVSGNGTAPLREDFVATQGQTTFPCANYLTSGEEIYRNGRLMRAGALYDYTISGQNIIFNVGLDLDDKVTALTSISLVASNMPALQTYVATLGQTNFVTIQPFVAGQERVYANGLRKQLTDDYTISGTNTIIFNSGRSLGDNVVVEVMPAFLFTSGMPQWKTFTVTHTQLQAASLTNDIELFSLLPGAVIHNVIISHTVPFIGGGRTSYTLSVGVSGNLTKYAAAFDVFQAAGSSVGQISNINGLEDKVSSSSIRLAAISDFNLNTSTAGTVIVKVLVSQAF